MHSSDTLSIAWLSMKKAARLTQGLKCMLLVLHSIIIAIVGISISIVLLSYEEVKSGFHSLPSY
jgi:hypothetical protein